METTPPALAGLLRSLPERMSHVVRPWAERQPDAPALVEGGRALSYAELALAIERTAQWLRTRGVRAGDRVMLLGENSIALALLVLAAGEADAWPLVVNARISAPEVDAIRIHSGARLVVCTSAVSHDAAAHAQRLGAVKDELPGGWVVGVAALDEAALPEPVHRSGDAQVGALIYTSGTTGAPKGVMLSHHGILFVAAVGGTLRRITPQDRMHGGLPMSHIVGFSVLASGLLAGASIELVARFDAAAVLQTLASGHITRYQGVPTMYQRLLEVAQGPITCPGLRTIGVAGAPLDGSLKAATEAAFGLPLLNGYGITECSPTIAFVRAEDAREDTAVGPPIPGIEVRLVGPQGPEVAMGDVGELHVRGPNVMLGYYRAADATAAAIDSEGWFNTGDLARMEGGSLHIAGRTKELIIRSGFNVYPPEVEAVIAAHPAVALCAVIGRKVPANEEVVAFVQLRPGSTATAEEIRAFTEARLAPYKRPAEVVIRQSLPATPAGKILKHQLAKEASL
jgi:long-chain acyl-CoA synthetase